MGKFYRLLLTMTLLFPLWATAQSQWIDFHRDYYKIETAEDGVYRISYTAFSASGINVNQVDPRDIRLYHRGEEVPILVQGQQDGRFDPGDHITFVGKKNDATLDYRLYNNPADMPNPYYNTHNDTTAYFLTVTPGVRGLRMNQTPAVNLSAPSVDIYQAERLLVFHDQYNLGPIYHPGIWMPEYDRGQGWMGPIIQRNNHLDFSLTNLGEVMAAGEHRVEMNLIGRAGATHQTAISAGPNANSLREVLRVTYDEYEVRNVEFNLLPTDYNSDGSIVIRVRSLGGESDVDNVSLSFLKLNYPKRASAGDFDQATFDINRGVERLTLSGVSADYVGFEINDRDNPRVLAFQKVGNELHIPGGGAAEGRKVLLQRSSQIKNVDRMRRFRFRDVASQPANYVMISHQSLRRPAASYGDPVAAYAAYRASPAGGGFDTLTVNMDQLYNQFSFGEKSPLAIYEFLRAYYPKNKPEYLLLLGRALGMFSTRRVDGVNYTYRRNPGAFEWQDLVPPAGYPYADNNFVQNLDPENPELQAIALGRVPARNPDEVASYLDKIKEKEALGVQEPWQKNIIHLSGGLSALELNRYFNFLNGFKNIAEDIYLGGSVKTFRKRSNATVELINISDEVNQGAAMVTFFGHASPALIDIEIGFASDPQMGYANKGRYPMLLLNGCDAGNAYGTPYTFGEDWVLARDAGSSNFIAHSNLGVDIYLRRYSESIYLKAFSDSSLIHQSIGKVRIEAEKHLYSRYGAGPLYRSHATMMVMLGDPAAKLFPANKADYAIKAEEVTLESRVEGGMSVLSDTLNLKFLARNIGRVDLDSFKVEVSRRLPDGTVIQYEPMTLPPVFRADTVTFPIPNRDLNAFGENFFTINLNSERTVDELTYQNNSVTISEFIQLNGTTNLMPLAYSIVEKPEATLIAQVTALSSDPRTVMFQMDTVPSFSSAVRRETRVLTTGLAKWEVDFEGLVGQKDSLTLYWRTKFMEPREGEDDGWNESSFSYIKDNPEGWTQRKLPQFRNNGLYQIEIDEPRREWRFEGVNLDLRVMTFGSQTEGLSFTNTEFLMDGISYILEAGNRTCPNGSLGLLSFQAKDLTPYLVFPPAGFDVLDGRSCGRVPQIIQSIRNNNLVGGNQMLLDYVDGVADGDYVLIFSVGNVTFSDWPDAAYIKLKEFGANEATLRNLRTGDPYILFGRKGMKPGEAIEIVPERNGEQETNEQILTFEKSVEGHYTAGSIISPKVGPASEWGALFQYIKRNDLFNQENTSMDLIGVTEDGEEVVLFEKLQENELSLASLNAGQYPFLRLRYAMDNPEADKPSQLNYWQVNYTGVPEGVLVFKGTQKQIQMREGEEEELQFEFSNISRHDFTDSLTVEWSFHNTDLRKFERFSTKIPPVPAGENHAFEVHFASGGRAGKNNLNVFVNPREVLEQSYQNNIVDLPGYFMVIPDDSRPVLDVSFDGVYIMDGDIVSPTVLVAASLKDVNSLMHKKDTVGMEVMLKRQCETCVFERVNFSSSKLKWFPATDESDFKVELKPGPLEDGMYTLRISNNSENSQEAEKPYEINFEVVNEAQITNFYPYPNPFSTNVRFVFTVTGTQVPDQIKIQIMTVTGKVVREIFQDELGPLRIGNNITEYAWNGKDEFGDQLANGVYIYRVLVLQNGQFMEHRATAGDKAFKKGYGKMYLLR
ncbi:transporter [Litoribacter ruber]|nr:transporter [Litoribacter ruber]